MKIDYFAYNFEIYAHGWRKPLLLIVVNNVSCRGTSFFFSQADKSQRNIMKTRSEEEKFSYTFV